MKICPSCERQLDEAAFNANRRKPDGLQSTCRACQAEHVRERWRKNGQDYNEKRSAQRKAARLERKQKQQDSLPPAQPDPLPVWLEQGICQRCGFGEECEARKRVELAKWVRGEWQDIRPPACSPEHPANAEWRAKYAHVKA